MAGVALALIFVGMLAAEPALAQARNPFSVGISEGGGSTTGLMGWILAQQGFFERSLAVAVRASRTDASGLWWLGGLSFVYGVLHAAGPGHGKAVLASYMVANERALRRGIVLSFMAALLQAAVAVALVGLLSLVFHATAIGMRNGAAVIEKVSYAGVTLLGCWLVWRKSTGLIAAWRQRRGNAPMPDAGVFAAIGSRPVSLAFAGLEQPRWPNRFRFGPNGFRFGPDRAARDVSPSRFTCVPLEGVSPDGGSPDGSTLHEHGPNCGHYHAPDPSTLGNGFSWRESMSTVVAAGARPCSGAILVLVFALAQGIFLAGVAATIVMALGTAITTAALAATAVLAKSITMKLVGQEDGRGALVARALEVAAAFLVLAVGLSLLFGLGPLQALA